MRTRTRARTRRTRGRHGEFALEVDAARRGIVHICVRGTGRHSVALELFSEQVSAQISAGCRWLAVGFADAPPTRPWIDAVRVFARCVRTCGGDVCLILPPGARAPDDLPVAHELKHAVRYLFDGRANAHGLDRQLLGGDVTAAAIGSAALARIEIERAQAAAGEVQASVDRLESHLQSGALGPHAQRVCDVFDVILQELYRAVLALDGSDPAALESVCRRTLRDLDQTVAEAIAEAQAEGHGPPAGTAVVDHG